MNVLDALYVYMYVCMYVCMYICLFCAQDINICLFCAQDINICLFCAQDINVLQDQEAIKQLGHILKTNVRACTAVGHPFVDQVH